MNIRILLVHSFTLFREALRTLLDKEEELRVVAQTGSAAEAIRLAEEHKPDVAIIDANMPGPSALEAARQMNRVSSSTRMLFLSATSDEEAVFDCMQAGASGFLPGDGTATELVAAIRQIIHGEKYLPPAALSRFVDGWRVRASGEVQRTAVLTVREREVLKLLAEGNSVKECAAALRVSAKTVEAHKFNLMRKLDIHNKAQLIHYAFQKKIVRLPMAS